jgi:hypothetical protein
LSILTKQKPAKKYTLPWSCPNDEKSTIGWYQVTVQANGSGKETIPPFSLEILQTAKFNVPSKIGTTAETVDVSTAVPILSTNDATLVGSESLAMTSLWFGQIDDNVIRPAQN